MGTLSNFFDQGLHLLHFQNLTMVQKLGNCPSMLLSVELYCCFFFIGLVERGPWESLLQCVFFFRGFNHSTKS